MAIRHFALTVLLVAAVFASEGCNSTMLKGERWYIDTPGMGVAYLPRTPAQVQAATVQALGQDLGFRLLSEAPNLVTAVTDFDQNVRVEIAPFGDGETRMVITMGVETPEMVIRQVMSHIETRLK